MYRDFKDKYSKEMSYNAFYKIFKTMNISMTLLGHEECEICELHELHKNVCSCELMCDISKYLKHRRAFVRARKEYKDDSKSQHLPNEIYTSADLQKVIMLPRMDDFKTAIFSRRLTVFNETFAELGTGKCDFAALWNEAIAGRQDEDLASTFHAYLIKVRDMDKVVFWLEN